MIVSKTKNCSKCKIDKLLDRFSPRFYKFNLGNSTICKDCINKQSKLKRKKYRGKTDLTRRAWRKTFVGFLSTEYEIFRTLLRKRNILITFTRHDFYRPFLENSKLRQVYDDYIKSSYDRKKRPFFWFNGSLPTDIEIINYTELWKRISSLSREQRSIIIDLDEVYKLQHDESMSLLQLASKFDINLGTLQSKLNDYRKTTSKKGWITMHREKMVGKIFGWLTVIRFLFSQKGESIYECRCTCGNILNVKNSLLQSEHTKSCGCIRKQIKKPLTIGQRIKHGTITAYEGRKNRNHQYKVRCDCGKSFVADVGHLRSGHTGSCGCWGARVIPISRQELLILRENGEKPRELALRFGINVNTIKTALYRTRQEKHLINTKK